MFLILGFDMCASTTTSSVTLFATAGVLWLKLVRLYRLATLRPSSFLPRQFFSTPKRFWVLLKSPERLKYPLFPFSTFIFLQYIFHMHVFLLHIFLLSFCLVCFFLFFSAHIFTVFSLAIGSPVGGPHSLGEIRGAAAVNVLSRLFAFAAHGGALGQERR